MTVNCVCFRPLLTSQGGGQVIGITNRLRAARSAVCISVGQKTYPKRPDRLWSLFATLFIGHRPGHEFDHSPSAGAEVNDWSYTSALLAFHGADREDLVLRTSVKPEFGNQQFCLWAFGSEYKSQIVWLLRPVRCCRIYGEGETTGLLCLVCKMQIIALISVA
jgi:hypothetical protein